MRLLADAMLGRLARWLRILGYDTAYVADTNDWEIVRLARAEDRLVLTRDRALAERRGLRALVVESQILEEQLRQVWQSVGPPVDPPFSRCPVCNQRLAAADPRLVQTHAPLFIQRTQTRFSWCAACQRVYWPGSHWKRMQTLLAGLRDGAGSDKMA